MKWLIAIIEGIIRGLFRKSPEERKEAKYEKALVRWEDELRILEQDYERTKDAFNAFVAGHHDTIVLGELERLHNEWSQACKALSCHRGLRPQRATGRAE